MDRRHQLILDAVLALYPPSRPQVTRVGVELECFVEPAAGPRFGWDEHLRLQERLRRDLRIPTVASLGLEPGGQWELRSVPLEGHEGLRAFASDARRIAEALRDHDCRVAFQGIRPGGTTGRLISPERRIRLLWDYLHPRSQAAAEMMADTAACQLTLDPLPLRDVLELLRMAVRSQEGVQQRWNASGPELSRRVIWDGIDPERCVPPRGMLDGEWSDEACLDHVLSLPCIVVTAADGRLVSFEGSFYDAMTAFAVQGDIGIRFAQFIKHIYYPVKPRVLPELRLLDSREPEQLPDLDDLLADLGLPGRCSSDRRPTVPGDRAASTLRTTGGQAGGG